MQFNRRSINVITLPTVLVVTVEEMKDSLRIDGTADDQLLELYIQSAIDAAQQYCRRSFITQTRELVMDGFTPDGDEATARLGAGVFNIPKTAFYARTGEIELPYGPVQSVTSIKTFDIDNAESTFSADNYEMEADRIFLNQGVTWPTNLRNRTAVKVSYVSGYGDEADNVPAAIRQGIRGHVQQMYECRGVCDLSDACKRLFDGYKLYDEFGFL